MCLLLVVHICACLKTLYIRTHYTTTQIHKFASAANIQWVSPTGRSVLLIGLGFVSFGLFRSLEALLNVEARAASSLVGEFWVDELTEDIVRSESGGLFWHERVH